MQPLITARPELPPAVGELSETAKEILLAYAENNMSARAVSTKLFRDYNGVAYHLNRIKKKTGLDPRNFFDLCKLVSAVNGAKVLDVLRCEACAWSKDAYIDNRGVRICPASGMIFGDDDYCSFAKRRADNAQRID